MSGPGTTVHVYGEDANGNWWETTGFAIGPHTILTTSQITWDVALQSPMETVGVDSLSSTGGGVHYNALGTAVNPTFVQNDFSIVETPDLTFTSWFDIVENFAGGTVNATGYPAPGEPGSPNQTTTTGTVSLSGAVLADGTLVTYPGMNGGPVYQSTAGSNVADGVISSGGWQNRISTAEYNQIKKWAAQDGYFLDGETIQQNTATGQVVINVANGDNLAVANPGATWGLVGAGDFNVDAGTYTLLLQNISGQVAIWDMSGATIVGGSAISSNPGPSWKAVGTADFNGDSHPDILFQNTSGQLAIWETDGTNIIGGGTIASTPGPGWKAIGTGDFNDDGRSDILFQNTSSGQVAIWEMNGTSIPGGGIVGAIGPGWQLVGTGDFNHDGHADILGQNLTTGDVAIWEMNGTSVIAAGLVANPGTSWHVMGTDGSGSDILLQATNGATETWDMSSGNIVAGHGNVAISGTSWQVRGATA